MLARTSQKPVIFEDQKLHFQTSVQKGNHMYYLHLNIWKQKHSSVILLSWTAGGDQEKAGGWCGSSWRPGGGQEETAEGHGGNQSETGGKGHRLRQAGENQEQASAGAWWPYGGPGPPETDRLNPGEETEEVWPGINWFGHNILPQNEISVIYFSSCPPNSNFSHLFEK